MLRVAVFAPGTVFGPARRGGAVLVMSTCLCKEERVRFHHWWMKRLTTQPVVRPTLQALVNSLCFVDSFVVCNLTLE